jgi:hypothetical protein
MANNPNATANLIPPKKGEIRNPKGYPKGLQHSSTRLKKLLILTENLTNPITHEVEGFTVLEQLDLAQIIKARKGDTSSYNTILDRLEGKARQAIDFTGELTHKYEDLTDEELDRAFKAGQDRLLGVAERKGTPAGE